MRVMRKTTRKTNVAVQLEPEVLKQVDALAAKEQRSRSNQIRVIVTRALEAERVDSSSPAAVPNTETPASA
jgi:metal-responsive CopG/Arc/MetJ family transcriptional regulator